MPEYRKVRECAGSFLNLCHNSKLAAKVTIQPIERYGFDAAIIFADILLIAAAIGQSLRFDEGHGPILEPALGEVGFGVLDQSGANDALATIPETVKLVRSRLDPSVAVIGFCGGAWTVATYMVAGRASGDHLQVRATAYRDAEGFQTLIDMLCDVSVRYLVAQAQAGADVLKIFDSWAGVLPETEFQRWVIEPTRRIVDGVRSKVPEIPIVGFPRGAGSLYRRFVAETGVDAVALDTQVSRNLGRELQAELPVQGNVDPVALEVGDIALDRAVAQAVENYGQGPYVFNLGHGIGKNTPLENVEQLMKLVKGKV